ncbi:molybdenum cofactor guanylyltransferase [Methylococcus capsulatus]|nr:molybdenum cofactor guanylyltransferase MobA [Methylococcus capsulatus]QXP91217.1 molybdenum cofactor guanylyltransferase [Methylococcus capsulatus]
MKYPSPKITGCVLAGGRGRRMGGRDKGLVPFRGRPLVVYALDALRSVAGRVMVSANRNRESYAGFGCPVIADASGEFEGPLAGVLSAMVWAETGLVLTMPCDTPLVTGCMLKRLAEEQAASDCDIAVAHDGERLHPVFLIARASLRVDLRAFLASGERRVEDWLARHQTHRVDYSDVPELFANVNSLEELEVLEARRTQPNA